MTRAERRRNAKNDEKKTKNIMLSNAEIQKIKDQAATEAMNKSILLLLGLSTFALRAEFSWGEKRLTRFTDRVISAYEAFEEGVFSLTDLHRIVYEETGIILTDDTDSPICDLNTTQTPEYHRENDRMADIMIDML